MRRDRDRVDVVNAKNFSVPAAVADVPGIGGRARHRGDRWRRRSSSEPAETVTVMLADFCATPGFTVSTEPSTFVFEIAAVGTMFGAASARRYPSGVSATAITETTIEAPIVPPDALA
jgi:hypothetical protein